MGLQQILITYNLSLKTYYLKLITKNLLLKTYNLLLITYNPPLHENKDKRELIYCTVGGKEIA